MPQRGMVLISSLLLLLVVTIFAISMFRSFGVEERIAGNVRDKERALHAAQSAQQYAEWWLTHTGFGTQQTTCAAPLNLNASQPPLCNTALSSIITSGNVASVPWMIGNQEVGTMYTPPNMNVNTSGVAGSYYGAPRFYIAFVKNVPAPYCGNVYQIDAWGYGGSSNSVAEVESTYEITYSSCQSTGNGSGGGVGGGTGGG